MELQKLRVLRNRFATKVELIDAVLEQEEPSLGRERWGTAPLPRPHGQVRWVTPHYVENVGTRFLSLRQRPFRKRSRSMASWSRRFRVSGAIPLSFNREPADRDHDADRLRVRGYACEPQQNLRTAGSITEFVRPAASVKPRRSSPI